MSDDAITACLQSALREHEIGEASPYKISFALKGKSGASFGAMQGDLAAGQSGTIDTFKDCLSKAGYTPQEVETLLTKLSVPCQTNPLTPEQTQRINEALESSHALVDAMDDAIFSRVKTLVEKCLHIAAAHGRSITSEGLLYIGLWVNMTGDPNKLIDWLCGKDPVLQKPVTAAPYVVDGTAMLGYLSATKYFISNPQNLEHMKRCVAGGMIELQRLGKD